MTTRIAAPEVQAMVVDMSGMPRGREGVSECGLKLWLPFDLGEQNQKSNSK